jgi:hypothetical protein
MRILLLTTILGFAAMYHESIIDEANRLLEPGDSAEVAAALEVRCGDATGLERQYCENDLRDAFARGTSDAGTIVRLHCTHFENGWSEDADKSPICASVREG